MIRHALSFPQGVRPVKQRPQSSQSVLPRLSYAVRQIDQAHNMYINRYTILY